MAGATFRRVAKQPATWKRSLSHKCFGPLPPRFRPDFEENKAATAPPWACAPCLAHSLCAISIVFLGRKLSAFPSCSAAQFLVEVESVWCSQRKSESGGTQTNIKKKKWINKEKLGKTLKTGARTSEQRRQNQNQQPKWSVNKWNTQHTQIHTRTPTPEFGAWY